MSDGEVGIGMLIGFLKKSKSFGIIAAALILGILLMLFGGSGGTSFAGSDTDSLEKQVEDLCARIAGVSDVHVMISAYTDKGTVRGVALVCSGGEMPEIKLKLTNLLCALFEIPSSAVSVVGGK